MINLLPPETARQIHASRHNNLLLRYLIGLFIALGLIIFVYATTFILMKTTEQSSVSSSSENKQKIAQNKETEDRAKAYTSNLKIAKALFDSELSHTTALNKIASALPTGTMIQALDLSASTVGSPITLSVQAKTKADALAVKTSFEKAKIASDITISSLAEQNADAPATDGESAQPTAYPVLISLNVTFDKSIFNTDNEDTDE